VNGEGIVQAQPKLRAWFENAAAVWSHMLVAPPAMPMSKLEGTVRPLNVMEAEPPKKSLHELGPVTKGARALGVSTPWSRRAAPCGAAVSCATMSGARATSQTRDESRTPTMVWDRI
jgi:hypothetical protein